MGTLLDTIRVFLDKDQIASKVAELGARITADHAGRELVSIGLLKGAYAFFADLTRAIPLHQEIVLMQAASYGDGTESSRDVKILRGLDHPIRGRHVLLIEDIVDTGRTLDKVRRMLLEQEPASLKLCTFLDKPCRREVEVPLDYVGFTIEDHFVVGYGMDLGEKYRNLPYVGIWSPE